MTGTPLLLDGASLTLDDLEAVARGRAAVGLTPAARDAVKRARRVVDDAVARKEVVYGVTTGFGNFADVVIPHDQLGQLQLNLVRSHAAGVGEPLDEAETRALMVLRANVLAKGFSGIRPETLDLLVAMLNARHPSRHPLAGQRRGQRRPGAPRPSRAGADRRRRLPPRRAARPGGRGPEAHAGLAPVTLEAKEGLALINGTQLMTAVTGLALAEAWRLARSADVIGALTLDALQGTDVAFDPRIHAARPHPGQQASARNLRRLLEGSAIRESHRDCGRVQDAYSLRCIPQVHGAVRDALDYATRVVAVEINAATDNPMVFAETGELLSGGNFHGEPVAIAADVLAIALAELGGISERRTERLVNPAALRPPRVPHRRRRPAVGVHDRARDRRRPRLREQVAGPSRVRRLDPDLGQQGRPRLHGGDRRPQGRARRGQHAAHPRHRGPGRLPGPGFPAAPADLARRCRPPTAGCGATSRGTIGTG